MIYEKNKISFLEVTRLKHFLDLARGIYYFNSFLNHQLISNKTISIPNTIIKKQTDNDMYSIIFCINSILDIIKKIHLEVKNIHANLNLQDIIIGRHRTFIHDFGTKNSKKILKNGTLNSNFINDSTFCIIPLANEIIYYTQDLITKKGFQVSAGDFLFFENESMYFGTADFDPPILKLIYSKVNNPVTNTRLLNTENVTTKNTNLNLHNIVQNRPIQITLRKIQDVIQKLEE